MIISKTPYRISFFGGGTDYPDWYLRNGGQVLSTSIDKYVYISCRYLLPFFDHRLRLVYTKLENCQNSNELDHPSARQVLKFVGIEKDLEIHYDGDLPARSGIGSSSAFTVGLLNALYKYKNINVSQRNLAKKSIHIEQNLIKECVGSQDQISVACGGFNHIKFLKNGKFVLNPVKLSKNKLKKLEKCLMLFHTGIFRTSETITKNYFKNYKKKENTLIKLNLIVEEAIDSLKKNQLDNFGKLLNETWLMKKNLSQSITNNFIDKIYNKAIDNGALGGKITGAGGGGFLLLYVPLNKQMKVKKALSNLTHVPFKFENKGSQIIFSKEFSKIN